MLKEEVEGVVRRLKAKKYPGVDKLRAGLLQKWRRSNNSPYSDMPVDLRGEGMAEGVDGIARRTFGKESQPQAISELS